MPRPGGVGRGAKVFAGRLAGGARGWRDHAGRGGGVRAPGPVHRCRCAGRPGCGADAGGGAGGAARADAVPGGDRHRGVHRPGQCRPRVSPAAAACRGSRGASRLPLVASGTAPYSTPGLAAVTDLPRYRELARRYGGLVADSGTCGCHVHVGGPPGISASRCWRGCGRGLRRCWPSPSTHRSRVAATRPGQAGGTRCGHAGPRRRRPRCGRTRPPTMRRSAASSGGARRWMSGASTSSRGCPRVTRPWSMGRGRLPRRQHRGAAGRADPRPRRDRAGGGPPGHAGGSGAGPWVGAALAAAARHGLAGPAVDAFTGQAVDARSLRSRLLDHVHTALRDRGDTDAITGLLHRLDQRGTGADRQRALFAGAMSAPGFVEALARATLSGDEPAGGRRKRGLRAAAGRGDAGPGSPLRSFDAGKLRAPLVPPRRTAGPFHRAQRFPSHCLPLLKGQILTAAVSAQPVQRDDVHSD